MLVNRNKYSIFWDSVFSDQLINLSRVNYVIQQDGACGIDSNKLVFVKNVPHWSVFYSLWTQIVINGTKIWAISGFIYTDNTNKLTWMSFNRTHYSKKWWTSTTLILCVILFEYVHIQFVVTAKDPLLNIIPQFHTRQHDNYHKYEKSYKTSVLWAQFHLTYFTRNSTIKIQNLF